MRVRRLQGPDSHRDYLRGEQHPTVCPVRLSIAYLLYPGSAPLSIPGFPLLYGGALRSRRRLQKTSARMQRNSAIFAIPRSRSLATGSMPLEG